MILGLSASTFTIVHVAPRLIGIVSGIIILGPKLAGGKEERGHARQHRGCKEKGGPAFGFPITDHATCAGRDRLARDYREGSMTTIIAFRLASVVTAINVLVASGFSIAAIFRPQYLVPLESVPTEASLLLAMYAAASRIPLALLVLGAIFKQATPALLILGALAGAMQLLDAGIGLFEHDLGKCAGPLFIAVLQFLVVYLLHRSVRITPQTMRG
jgi:hypothetical protein